MADESADRSGTAPRGFRRTGSLRPRAGGRLVDRDESWLGGGLPLLVRSRTAGLSLAEHLTEHRDALAADLLRHGGLLFRGFDVPGAAGFAAAAEAFAPDLLGYKERSSPRSQVDGEVYTSTEHPADQEIVLHSEQSYTVDWPVHIMFHCDAEPATGGATPIADNRRIERRLPEHVRDRFAELGVLYVRNYSGEVGLGWREAFQTGDPAGASAFCERNEIAHEWLGDDRLRTWQRRSAFQTHPDTGERLWFNHGLFFNAHSLPAGLRDALLAAVGESGLPTQTRYGDGSPIDPADLAAVRAAVDAETVRFDWRRGDVLILDNMLCQHGREAFTGDRRILTIMATSYRSRAVPEVPATPAALDLAVAR